MTTETTGSTGTTLSDLAGKTAIVTGANSGLGLASARELARRGARVVMAVRDVARGEVAGRAVREAVPGARVAVEALDLADLSSVRAFAGRVERSADRLDVLLNNAGVMMPRQRRTTADGFELQFGTNHLGHWALTALLLPLMLRTAGSRVVTVSSLAAQRGALGFDDLQWERGYRPSAAYAASKLANLLFAVELDRRLRVQGRPTLSVAAHPGVAATNLAATMGVPRAVMAVSRLVLQDAEAGARPQLHAALAADAEGGAYYGPGGLGGVRGRDVARLTLPRPARDPEVARRLWDVSEELTGHPIELPPT